MVKLSDYYRANTVVQIRAKAKIWGKTEALKCVGVYVREPNFLILA